MSGTVRGIAVLVGAFAAVVGLWPRPASACSCVMGACASLEHVAGVFEATVVRVTTEAGLVGSRWTRQRRVTLGDVTPIHGTSATSVVTPVSSGACGVDFTVGVRYLVVATREPDGTLSTMGCSGTRPLSEAAGWLERMNRPAGATYVWGDVRSLATGRPVPNARVHFGGRVGGAVRADGVGRFVVRDLLPGRYEVTAEAPAGVADLATSVPSRIILGETRATSCASVSLSLRAPAETGITGRVTDDEGRPLAGVWVDLQSVDSLPAPVTGTGTNRDGRYVFRRLPPGRYRVGVNLGLRPAPRQNPYSKDLALDEAGSGFVDIEVGETPSLADMVVRRLHAVELQGLVIRPDGRPADGVLVNVGWFDGRGTLREAPRVRTSVRGRFELRLWRGDRYRLLPGTPEQRDVRAGDEARVVLVVPER